MPFDLQRAINEAYAEYKAAELKARQEMEEEQRKKESEIINSFKQRLDTVLSENIQKALEVKIEAINILSNKPAVTAKFKFCGVTFTLKDYNSAGAWFVKRSDENEGCVVNSCYLQNDILIELGILQESLKDLGE